MTDGHLMRNDGSGWKAWKRLKAGVDPRYAIKLRSAFEAQPPEFHTYIRPLMAA